MKTLLLKAALGVGLLAAAGAYAEAPAGATAECKDGTYYSGTTHKGACRGHQGVKSWIGSSAAASTSTAAADTSADTGTTAKKTKKAKKAAAAEAAAPAAAAAPATAPAAAPAAAAPAPAPKAAAEHKAPTPASEITQKAGGGPGLVWVNSSSKVYHCSGDEWYGKTKEGSYMSESAAKAEGDHAAHGKECGK